MKSSRRRSLRIKLTLAAILAALIGVVGPSFLKISSDNAPLLRAVVEAATTDTITLTSPLPLPGLSGVVLEQGRVGIAGLRNARSRSVDATQAMLQSGRADLLLSDAVFSIDPSRFGKQAVSGADAVIAPLIAALTGLSFDKLRLDDATVVIRRSDGGKDVLTNVDAEIVATRKSSIRASGSLRYLGAPLQFETTLANADETRPGARLPVVLKFKGPLIEGDIDGTLVLAEQPQLVSSRARMTVLDVPGMAGLFGLTWPEQATMQRADARGKFSWAGRTVALDDAAFVFDGNEATGALSLSLTGKRPLLDATLAFGRLDVSRYLGLPEAAPKQAQIVPALDSLFSGSRASAAPPGSELDADVRISAEVISGLPLEIGRFSTTVSLKSGHLSADVTGFEADGCGDGRAEINIDFGAAQPRTVLAGRCDQFDLAAASTLMLGHAPLEGRGTASVELSASGRTAAELQATLAGKVDLTVANGGRIGISVPTLAADKRLKTAGLLESPSWGKTSIESLRVRCVAEGGIFRLTEFDAAVGPDRVLATGMLSVPARVIDVTFRTAKLSGVALQKNSRPAPPESSAIRILGPWSKPFVRTAPEADGLFQAAPDLPTSRTAPAPLTAPYE